MNATAKAQKILKELDYDFAAFTMDGFLRYVSQSKGREIMTFPCDLPTKVFGIWVSSGEDTREYIFYRKNLLEIHKIHILLHELSHFLCGHPTLKITRQFLADFVKGKTVLPVAELPRLRAPEQADYETEAEALVSMIQKQVVRNSKLTLLIHDTAPEENLANFLKEIGV